MLPGEFVTRWTVRLALAGYFVGGALRTLDPTNRNSRLVGQMAWTLGWLFYLAHVLFAFHFYHGWSHAEAYRHTAERTAALTGWNWGGGLYFNYAFTAIWLADVLAWWTRSDRKDFRWLDAVIQSFLWFMVFNATVVFGQGAIRWVGLAGCTMLSLLWLRSVMNQRRWR